MVETLKEYATKRLDLIKIQATEKTSISAGIIAFLIIFLIAFAFFIILFNFGLAFLIGNALNNTSYGFLIVAAFYIVVMIVVVIFKKKIVNLIANKVVQFINH
ncbi:Putative Holin-X, holin superfamily III [Chryseobacterium piscicola]|jgi:hypothetical protein|uniref:Putative Holin-X, holin superfamily III n=1 Tax=Chryseobacterium piscicola TaxID=551459 RepID=A0A1N7LYC9_9FLAO|nr:phage holin family protein [Chryseobacterium piscicola]PQA92567.1 hypothetical protein B0A70_10950 [Chryseobacterium piscicola]SIS78826.1 Putative Holin-X, holin superfamily III [Chryseobacterium piscicola]